MSNSSKHESSKELPPAIRELPVYNPTDLAEAVITQLGQKREFSRYDLYDASWEDQANNRYEFQKTRQPSGRYVFFLNISKPFVHFPNRMISHDPASHQSRAYRYNQFQNLEPTKDASSRVDQIFTQLLLTSGVETEPIIRNDEPLTDYQFWEIACWHIAESSPIQKVLSRGREQASRAENLAIDQQITEQASYVVPNLPESLVGRILVYADITHGQNLPPTKAG